MKKVRNNIVGKMYLILAIILSIQITPALGFFMNMTILLPLLSLVYAICVYVWAFKERESVLGAFFAIIGYLMAIFSGLFVYLLNSAIPNDVTAALVFAWWGVNWLVLIIGTVLAYVTSFRVGKQVSQQQLQQFAVRSQEQSVDIADPSEGATRDAVQFVPPQQQMVQPIPEIIQADQLEEDSTHEKASVEVAQISDENLAREGIMDVPQVGEAALSQTGQLPDWSGDTTVARKQQEQQDIITRDSEVHGAEATAAVDSIEAVAHEGLGETESVGAVDASVTKRVTTENKPAFQELVDVTWKEQEERPHEDPIVEEVAPDDAPTSSSLVKEQRMVENKTSKSASEIALMSGEGGFVTNELVMGEDQPKEHKVETPLTAEQLEG